MKWIAIAIAGIALAVAVTYCLRQTENKLSSTIHTLAFGTTESCTTDVGGCPFHSISVSYDGSYLIDGDRCVGTETCKGQLTKAEVTALGRLLEDADVPSLRDALQRCQKIEPVRSREWTWLHIESGSGNSVIEFDTNCAEAMTASRLKNLRLGLEAILKPDSRVFSEASELVACEARASLKSEPELWALFYTNVKLHVASDGTTERFELAASSGNTGVDKAALLAAKSCKYVPAKRNGRPVGSTAKVGYYWTLDNPHQTSQGSEGYPIRGLPSVSEVVRDEALAR